MIKLTLSEFKCRKIRKIITFLNLEDFFCLRHYHRQPATDIAVLDLQINRNSRNDFLVVETKVLSQRPELRHVKVIDLFRSFRQRAMVAIITSTANEIDVAEADEKQLSQLTPRNRVSRRLYLGICNILTTPRVEKRVSCP